MRMLDVAVKSGYFGKNPNEAVERLLAEALRRLVKEGELKQLIEQDFKSR
jgi:hypothetical protein